MLRILLLLTILLCPLSAYANLVVRMTTVVGPIDIELFEAATPLTVANFLSYADAGAYDLSFIHRSEPGFVIQGGSFRFLDLNQPPDGIRDTFVSVAANPPMVPNEPGISNLRGTLAMAKLSGQPDSATTSWYFNVSDNVGLDTLNDGFTVFGDVQGNDMSVVDLINFLPRVDASAIDSALSTLPLVNFTPGDPFDPNSQLVYLVLQRSPDAQCGDLNSDSRLALDDIDLLRLSLADPVGYALTPEEFDLCSVIESAEDCDLIDATVLLRRQHGLQPRRSQLCDAANP